MSIRIVLVETTHPGNIGAAARAMKTMGLADLWLVKPLDFPCSHATAMAAGADDVLASATVVDTLDEALADCQLVIASSARDRSRPWPMLSPKAAAVKARDEGFDSNVAVVFGRERSGLNNEELQKAQFHVQIPSVETYSSLNLSQAVQVICYEIRLAHLSETKVPEKVLSPYADQHKLELFYTHLEETLKDIGFLDPENPKHLMAKMRRLFSRARLEELELSLLRGILSDIQKK